MSCGRHVPVRTCVGCGERATQPELLRVSTVVDGTLELVRERRYVGRTGYLHPRPACWERFASRKGPVRSLRRTIDKATRLAFVAELKRMSQFAMIG